VGIFVLGKKNNSERNKSEENDDDDDDDDNASEKKKSDGSHEESSSACEKNESKANEVKMMQSTTISANDSQQSHGLDHDKQQQQRIRQWTDRIMMHKKLSERFEYWSGQIAIYHRWCSEHDGASNAGVAINSMAKDKDSKKKKRKRTDNQKMERDANQRHLASLDSTVFVKLGRTETDDVEDEEGENERDGDDLDDPFASSTKKAKKTKKNRPGQRDRRAAAIAAGRPASENVKRRDPASTKDKTDATERLHPSWEARKSQKDGIVAFAGKKITFGDDSNEATAGSNRSDPHESASPSNASVWKEANEKTLQNHPQDKRASQVHGHGHRRRDDGQVEKLHPSWQASKLKKEGIVAFAGKKITFDAS